MALTVRGNWLPSISNCSVAFHEKIQRFFARNGGKQKVPLIFENSGLPVLIAVLLSRINSVKPRRLRINGRPSELSNVRDQRG